MIPPRGTAPLPVVASTSVAAPGLPNEDAVRVLRGSPTVAAIADGAGRAGGAARRVLELFARLLADSAASAAAGGPADSLASFPGWLRLLRLLDSSLLGGAESTFLAVALLGNRLTGVYAGADRAVLLRRDGTRELVTAEPGGPRLGSGRCVPQPIHRAVGPGDVVLLATDGLWKALSLERMDALVRRTPASRFADLPALLVEEAGRRGRDDDMSCVVLRVPAASAEPRAVRAERQGRAAVQARVYRALRDTFAREPAWIDEADGTLTWFTARTRVRITVAAPRPAPWGEQLVPVTVESIVATRVRADAVALAPESVLDPRPDVAALVYDPTWRRCSYVTRLDVPERRIHSHVGWLRQLLILQMSRCHAAMDRLVHQLDARPPTYRHPLWGLRPRTDDVVVAAVIPDEPRGEHPWHRRDLDLLIAKLGEWGICSAVRDAGGDQVRFDIVDSSAELELTICHPTPEQGRGLRVRLLPPGGNAEPFFNLGRARRLNRYEARGWTGFGLIGGWSVEQGRLVFSTFLPELAYMLDLAGWVCWAGARRMWWLRGMSER